MKKYGFILLLAVLSSFSISLHAQKDSSISVSPISISCDIMSRYVWRGTDYGSSPNIQPGVEFNKYGITIGAWGAYALNFQGYQESDLYLGYTFFKNMFSIMLSDYYFQNDTLNQNYFDYKKETTSHVFEASLTFNGTENFPLSVLIATNIYGADAKHINNNGTTGKNDFSSYAELSYSFKYLNVFMGFNLTKVDTDKGETGYYGNTIGVVNLGATFSKNIKITNSYSLPVSVSLITNPQTEKIYFVAGLSF